MTSMTTDGLKAAQDKMRSAGQHAEAILSFTRAYERLADGESALLPSAELEPAQGVPSLAELPQVHAPSALERVAVIKLNGGLATTMGLQQPKSLVVAHRGLTFLDIIIGQTLALRQRYGVRLPLLLMNSQATRRATLAALSGHPELDAGLPLDVHAEHDPQARRRADGPVSWPPKPELRNGARRATVMCTARSGARASWPSCSSRASATR